MDIITCIHGREKITDLFLLYHERVLREEYGKTGMPRFIIGVSEDDPQLNEGSVLRIMQGKPRVYDGCYLEVIVIPLKNDPIGNKWNETIRQAYLSKVLNGEENRLFMTLGSDDFLHYGFFSKFKSLGPIINERNIFFPERFIATNGEKSILMSNLEEFPTFKLRFGSGRICSYDLVGKLIAHFGYAIDPNIRHGLDGNFIKNTKEFLNKKLGIDLLESCFYGVNELTVYSYKKEKCLNDIDKIIQANPNFEAGHNSVMQEFKSMFGFLFKENHEKAKEQASSYFDLPF